MESSKHCYPELSFSGADMLRSQLILVLLLFSFHLYGKNSFYIAGGKNIVIVNAKELRKRSSLIKMTIPLLAYPGKNIEIDAVPVSELLTEAGVDGAQLVMFKCLDGFSGAIDLGSLLASNSRKSRAYLAIEPDKKWPALGDKYQIKGHTAGPFYLVWKNPEASHIPAEYWPYQLVGLHLEGNIEGVFPGIIPTDVTKNSKVGLGFEVYRTRCLSCHQINKQGPSTLGPDLNLPLNPVEYFQDKALRSYLKNPESVRSWPGMKMRWIAGSEPTDKEIDRILAYLKYMAEKKVLP